VDVNRESGKRVLFLAWLGLFAGISVLLWAAVQFWGLNLKLGVPAAAEGKPASRGARVLPPPNNMPVLDLEEITESNARPSFVGRMVRFDDLTVKETGPSTFRVGRAGGRTLLVVSSEPGRPEVREGEKVTLQGMILNAPDTAGIQKQWGLDPTRAAQAEREQVYLRASMIEKR
jgi:hypothetical protein